MTLFTTDYLEYYLTLVSWIVNNGIWAVLVSSGVFALPFVAIIVQEWLKARAEGADEGNKGVLSAARIENRVFVAIVVVMFAGIPFIDVDLNTIQYDSSRSAQCQVSVPAGRSPSAPSTTSRRRCRCGGRSCMRSRAPSRALRWQRSRAARTCGRCAWRSTPRASMTRCWLRK